MTSPSEYRSAERRQRRNVPAHPELQARTTRYQELMQTGLPMLFPQGVDVALDSSEPVGELLASEEFVRQSREANAAYGELYRADQWTPKVIATGVLPDGTLLIDLYCEGWLRHLSGYSIGDKQEQRAQLREGVLLHAHQFVPGKVEQGVYVPFRFATLLSVFAFRSALRGIKRDHERFVATVSLDQDEDDGEEIPEPSYEPWPGDVIDECALRDALGCVLPQFPWKRRTLDIVFGMAFEGESMRAVGRRLRISHVQVGRILEPLKAAFVEKLMQSYPEAIELDKADYTAFTGLIGRLFSVEQFISLGLRPVE